MHSTHTPVRGPGRASATGLPPHQEAFADRSAPSPRWYSPRGARRGLWLAGLTAALWLAWALNYVQGLPQATFVSPPPPTTLASAGFGSPQSWA